MEERPNLYHYTDQHGMLGMVQNKTIWMTNIRYMNDVQEYKYGLDYIRNFIHKNYHPQLGNQLNDPALQYQQIPPTFSFSLSENKDLLSQWRGYCPNGGYSLSFNPSILEDFLTANNLRIQRCLYDEAEIDKFIEEKIVRMSPEKYKEAVESTFYNKPVERMPNELVKTVFREIPFIKHYAFREEREWRILSSGHHEQQMSSFPDVKFRSGNNRLIPYLQFSADHVDGNLIEGATLSPREHDELALESAKALLRSDSVYFSDIPYRA